jgi:hypothetical protein
MGNFHSDEADAKRVQCGCRISAIPEGFQMSTLAKRAPFVLAALLSFTIYAIGRRVGLILSGHASPMVVGFVAADAFHRLLVLVAPSVVVCVFFTRQAERTEALR